MKYNVIVNDPNPRDQIYPGTNLRKFLRKQPLYRYLEM